MFKIVDAVVIIDHFFCGGIVVQRIYGEISPRRVLGVRAKLVVAQNTTMPVGGL